VVCRVAPSFLRIGNYELPTARGDVDLLRRLVAFTRAAHFPELGGSGEDALLAWYREVCRRNLLMVVEWQRVGFVHGVMNTDNMSVLGLTIDYGPYGWLDDFDPDWTPNTTDAGGRRYRFGHQPQVTLWNLVQLGRALAPLVEDVSRLQAVVDELPGLFESAWQAMFAAKLGLASYVAATDDALVADLLALLRMEETDMTLFHRHLADVDPSLADDNASAADVAALVAPLLPAYYGADGPAAETRATLVGWLRRYAARVAADGRDGRERRAAMNRVNPKFVLRNYLAQEAIDAATAGDTTLLHALHDVLRQPYDEHPEHETWAGRRPDWARDRAGCSMLSCSS
jgi:uncharacterized protein YdiU (UPF0061 family)